MNPTIKFLALLVAVLIAVQLASTAPLKKEKKGHKGHKHGALPVKVVGNVKTGEHPIQKLPKGTPQAHGLATNWTQPTTNSAVQNDGIPVSTHRVTTLKNYARLASTAYCVVGTENGPFTCGSYCDDFPETTIVKTFNTPKTSSIGFVARNDNNKAIYVAYRGSANLGSFIQDAKFVLTDYPPVAGAKVHYGFLEDQKETREIVYDAVVQEMEKHEDYTLYMLGHSLGGTAAVLQALDFYQNAGYDSSKMVVYTYGEPRIGNPAFVDYVDSLPIKFFRTVNRNDIVPHLPPENFGYQHHGNEHWIENASGDVVLCSTNEDSSCADSVVPFTSISSHLMYWDIKMSVFAC
ncbi:Alpha/Beta hydrolase protein [Jimgerdemannia flammicorona]|uniref:Alpha/Beta hydrolase protein n=1 Tax=Jimgerdemannia flammicorona TaxID=994334 RepID=A0A433CVY0_9FUNG|nr:Alpha/Beta hydrolase protein [Jimgerdemannia flammicorona]